MRSTVAGSRVDGDDIKSISTGCRVSPNNYTWEVQCFSASRRVGGPV